MDRDSKVVIVITIIVLSICMFFKEDIKNLFTVDKSLGENQKEITSEDNGGVEEFVTEEENEDEFARYVVGTMDAGSSCYTTTFDINKDNDFDFMFSQDFIGSINKKNGTSLKIETLEIDSSEKISANNTIVTKTVGTIKSKSGDKKTFCTYTWIQGSFPCMIYGYVYKDASNQNNIDEMMGKTSELMDEVSSWLP